MREQKFKKYKTNSQSIKNGILFKLNWYASYTSLDGKKYIGTLKDGTDIQVFIDNKIKGYELIDVSGCENHLKSNLTFKIINTYKKIYKNYKNDRFKKHIVVCIECNIKLLIMTELDNYNNISWVMGFK